MALTLPYSFGTATAADKLFFTQLQADLAQIVTWSGAGQISFPATQNPSADANTLDDYEEGTWTPVLTFATPGDLAVTYSVQTGSYTKIGRQVTVSFLIICSAFTYTTSSGNYLVTGLPFTVGTIAFGNVTFTGITKAGYTAYTAQALTTTTTLGISAAGSGVAAAAVTAANVASGGTPLVGATVTYNV